jgi:hypothetical protein
MIAGLGGRLFAKKREAETPQLQVDPALRTLPAWARLEDQIGWYDKSSNSCQLKYKVLKTAQIVLAASIPLGVFYESTFAKWGTGIAGALIAVIEAVQQLGQYSALWLTYRATAEYLKHEKYLFLSGAGPYKALNKEERLTLLAERIEERVSAEHANWINDTRKATSAPATSGRDQ